MGDTLCMKSLFEIFCNKEQRKYAIDKIWITREGTFYTYAKLTDSHLKAILELFTQNRFNSRKCHLKGLQQEKLRRESIAGEVLFGD